MEGEELGDIPVEIRMLALMRRQAEAAEAVAKEKARLAEAEESVVNALQKIALNEQRRAVAVEDLLTSVGELTVDLSRNYLARTNYLLDVIERVLQQQPLSAAFNEFAEKSAHTQERMVASQKSLIEVLYILLTSNVVEMSLQEREAGRDTLRRAMTDISLPSPGELTDELPDDPKSLKRQLRTQWDNLHILQEREAKHGGFAPLSLLNEQDVIREKIKIIEKKLEGLEDDT
jgi:hypothetical protein